MNEVVYINYLSRPRNNSEKEKNWVTNRIATKKVLREDITKTMPMKQFYFGNPGDHYITFQIPKRNGTMRTIEAPDERLKPVQQDMLKYFTKILKMLPHNAAHGFTANRNCKTALEVHRKHKSRWFLKVDIHDFFGSTTEAMVAEAFANTYPTCNASTWTKNSWTKICTKDGKVPQGAPTSPFICNLVMIPYDMKIQNYCHKNGLIYTRYADDILISSRCDWDWRETLTFLKKCLSPYTLSEDKTRYGNFNGRNWNLGIMYNNQYRLTIGHEKKNIIKVRVHNFLTKPETRTDKEWYSLMGTLSYAKYIEPDYEKFDWWMTQLSQFRPTNVINTTPNHNTHNETEHTDTIPF